MTEIENSQILRIIPILVAVCLLTVPTQAKYGGGSGTAEDPYQIATLADLIALGETPSDYDKHFVLTADIDLDPNLPGCKVFDKAIIAPDTNDSTGWFEGTSFTGVFDGNGHTISHLTIVGKDFVGLFGRLESRAEVRYLGVVNVNVVGSSSSVAGLVGDNYYGTVTHCFSTGRVSGEGGVGGLVGRNSVGTVGQCYSTATVSGTGYSVGGLVGLNSGTVANCYSTGAVSGWDFVGGLVGTNGAPGDGGGAVTECYSTGKVTGRWALGLIGMNSCMLWCADMPWAGTVTGCFWDTQTSGAAGSDGGEGKTTAQMHTASTFLDAGWDFVGETANGTQDIWWILEGKDYPTFVWEHLAFSPDPPDGAADVTRSPILSWHCGETAAQHDVYFGDDKNTVANATPEILGTYGGRQLTEVTTYEPGTLEWGKTYYWRIDEVNEVDPNSPWKGTVWSFTTADFIIVTSVDDFESYTDDMGAGQAIFQTWLDGTGCPKCEPAIEGNGTGSSVGNWYAPFAELLTVHSGVQSMPMDYNNAKEPWYSEAQRNWATPQDWTFNAADTLTLYFRGEPGNGRDRLYVGIEDSAGGIAVVVHPDADAVLATEWQKWHIALADVRAAGVDVAAVKKMVIGVGDRNNPQPGGIGRIYIDDIRLTWRFVLVDFDGDMDTDFLDFCILAEHWRGTDSSFWCAGGGTDLTNDGLVNWQDLMVLAENWLTGLAP